jgi:hypothetical protein
VVEAGADAQAPRCSRSRPRRRGRSSNRSTATRTGRHAPGRTGRCRRARSRDLR